MAALVLGPVEAPHGLLLGARFVEEPEQEQAVEQEEQKQEVEHGPAAALELELGREPLVQSALGLEEQPVQLVSVPPQW